MYHIIKRVRRIRSLQINARKPPTAKGYFDNRAIVPEIIANLAIEGKANGDDKAWFVQHVEIWVRYLHANNKDWRTKLERESNDDRDFVIAFVNHWADAFVKDPQSYRDRHPHIEQTHE